MPCRQRLLCPLAWLAAPGPRPLRPDPPARTPVGVFSNWRATHLPYITSPLGLASMLLKLAAS
jgi:hypothetical protein